MTLLPERMDQFNRSLLKQELLTFKSFIETHLIYYLLDRFPAISAVDNFALAKNICVREPFGKTTSRKKGMSTLKPEFCVKSGDIGIVAEAAAWNDDASANKQSESHRAMHTPSFSLNKRDIYFAQKVMCQLFPAVLYCMEDKKIQKVFAFISVTENHYPKMCRVLRHLKALECLDNYSRPLHENDKDVEQYYQVIFECVFPKQIAEVTKLLKKK